MYSVLPSNYLSNATVQCRTIYLSSHILVGSVLLVVLTKSPRLRCHGSCLAALMKSGCDIFRSGQPDMVRSEIK